MDAGGQKLAGAKALVERALAANRLTWRSATVLLVAAVILVVGGWSVYQRARGTLPPGIARTNGRIEAERIDVATKFAGRIAQVLVAEGDMVEVGQVVARLDTSELEAQLREAEAAERQAERQLDQANALLAQRQAELKLAEQQLTRSLGLVGKGYTPREVVDQREAAKITAEAALNSAFSQIALAKAGIEAAAARVLRLKVDINDSTLRAPRRARVQYRLALAGEVLGAGGKVVTLLDLADVYMTIFLPTRDAGRLALNSEARLVFDAAPQWTVPATVTFVASEAQFTPKYVETATEREKLMFRVKLHLPKDVLEKYTSLVKTGVPGVAYVKVDRSEQWPARLAVKLPP